MKNCDNSLPNSGFASQIQQEQPITTSQVFQDVNQHKKTFQLDCGVLGGDRENPFDVNQQVYISRPEELRMKIEKMKRDGLSELQIVSDFDQTITAFKSGGSAQQATFGIIRNYPFISPQFIEYCQGLFNKYHPIEVSKVLSKEEKAICMEQWNDALAIAYEKEGLLKSNILLSLQQSNVSLRHHFGQFLKQLSNSNLPFYIISGGVSYYLKTILNTVLDINEYKNMFVFSNEGSFNEETGVLEKMNMLVNSSKKSLILSNDSFEFRKNVLLLGDFPHDILMKENMKCETSISVFFLRDQYKADLEELQKEWDIIVCGDGSFLLPHLIVDSIAGEVNQNVRMPEDMMNFMNETNIFSEINKILSNGI